ncbi:MAG: prepilin-type N-terminal cleavage/methylation domain-containing protein [Planctomycetota bacterium]
MNRISPQPVHRFAAVRTGFTLVELLVAIAVLSLMMTLAARIFFDAQTGVQRGLQTSQIIAESRSIAQPMAEDVRAMNVFVSKYGSNSPGFLVINQNTFPGVRYPEPEDINTDPSTWTADRNGNGTPGEPADLMRSDQIAFFRDANELDSLTPGQNDRYDSQAKARHARVWYGHIWPTDVTPTATTAPGDVGYDLSSQLVLGRQAALIIEEDAATTYPDGSTGDSGLPGAGVRYAGGVNPNDALFDGLSDVLPLAALSQFNAFDFRVYDDTGIDPPAGEPRGMFRTPGPGAGPFIRQSVYGFQTGAFGLTDILYAGLARHWLFIRNGERLRGARSVSTDFETSARIFTADDLAPLHTPFAPHVADFAIEFAADWSDDWNVSTPGTRVAGADGLPDYEPDRDTSGNIIWYTAAAYANPDLVAPFGIGDLNPNEPVTYAIPANISNFDTASPGVIPNPFAYQYNPGTDSLSAYTNATTNVLYVFAHTGDDLSTDETTNPPLGQIEGNGKYWPYLIRFRYRLMDGKGEFRSIETNPVTGNDFSVVGRWFEQVVPVPRPQGLY